MLYRDFAPTGFDDAGAFLDDRQDWIVVPCMHNRDSEHLDKSNFDAALTILGGESETLEVHRFGHWGPGWFEIIIVHPSRADEVEDIADCLRDYPVLDEEDLCRREWEDSIRQIEEMGWGLVRADAPADWTHRVMGVLADTRDFAEEDVAAALFALGMIDEDEERAGVLKVVRDGEVVFSTRDRDEALDRGEYLWHKGLWQRDVSVVSCGEVVWKGGEL